MRLKSYRRSLIESIGRSFWILPTLLAVACSGCTVILRFGSTIASVQVTPANPTILVGGTQQFVANATQLDGFIILVTTGGVVWGSSKPAVATINSSGLATGLGPGVTIITATVDSVSGSTTLTVTAKATTNVSVAGSAGKVEVAFPASDQRFLYVANPMDEAISWYSMDPGTGRDRPGGSISVAPARGSLWLAVHPSGRFLYVANHASGNISAFSIDRTSGRLTGVAGSPLDAERGPWAISVDADGQFLQVTHLGTTSVSRYRIDPATGALTLEKD